MDAFIKSYSDFRTIKKLSILSDSLVLDSLDPETSTLTVLGTPVTHKNAGDWLIVDQNVFRIVSVTPKEDRTLLSVTSPIEAFSRPLELTEQHPGSTIGGFIYEAMLKNWISGGDPAYAINYLVVSNSDTTSYVAPDLDGSGCFKLSEYCRLMRKSYRVNVRFTWDENFLVCSIRKDPVAYKQVSFEDGRSKLVKVAYASKGIAKLTVLCDTTTTEKDENGANIVVRTRSDWYLSESGEVSQEIPAKRAQGDWSTIRITGKDDLQAKVVEAFAKNKSNHKLEFWSTRELDVSDTCTFYLYGELLTSYISSKRKNSNDNRYYYKSGELATTATEKLKGAIT